MGSAAADWLLGLISFGSFLIITDHWFMLGILVTVLRYSGAAVLRALSDRVGCAEHRIRDSKTEESCGVSSALVRTLAWQFSKKILSIKRCSLVPANSFIR